MNYLELKSVGNIVEVQQSAENSQASGRPATTLYGASQHDTANTIVRRLRINFKTATRSSVAFCQLIRV